MVGKCDGDGNSISQINEDGSVVCKSVNENITSLKSQLATLESTLQSIQAILTPLVDRATKQIHSIIATNSLSSHIIANALVTLSITGAANGDYISILPQSNNGCTNAHLHYYVVDSSITIKLTSGLVLVPIKYAMH